VPSMYAIQHQSLVDKGLLPTFDLEVPNADASSILKVCPEDPGIDPWRGREPDDIDPGFNPWRGRRDPDNIDPGFNPWRGHRDPDNIDPGFNPWRGRRDPDTIGPWLPDDRDSGFDGWKPQES